MNWRFVSGSAGAMALAVWLWAGCAAPAPPAPLAPPAPPAPPAPVVGEAMQTTATATGTATPMPSPTSTPSSTPSPEPTPTPPEPTATPTTAPEPTAAPFSLETGGQVGRFELVKPDTITNNDQARLMRFVVGDEIKEWSEFTTRYQALYDKKTKAWFIIHKEVDPAAILQHLSELGNPAARSSPDFIKFLNLPGVVYIGPAQTELGGEPETFAAIFKHISENDLVVIARVGRSNVKLNHRNIQTELGSWSYIDGWHFNKERVNFSINPSSGLPIVHDGMQIQFVYDFAADKWTRISPEERADGRAELFSPEEKIKKIIAKHGRDYGLLHADGSVNHNAFEVLPNAQGEPAIILVRGGEGRSPYGLSDHNFAIFKQAVGRLNEIDPNIINLITRAFGLKAIGRDFPPFIFDDHPNYAASYDWDLGTIHVNFDRNLDHEAHSTYIAAISAILMEARGLDSAINRNHKGELDSNDGIDKGLWIIEWIKKNRSKTSSQEYNFIMDYANFIIDRYRNYSN